MNAFFGSAADWASALFYAAAALGCFYALFAVWAARRFNQPDAAAILTHSSPRHPAVTILKPLCGLEPNLYANLAGFCVQDYPAPVQIVFGVDDSADPAIRVVRNLIADFPDRDLKLVVDPRRHGENRKVSNLINMLGAARHNVFVVSDSDIVVTPRYLKTVIADLERPGVGLVSCLYRGAAACGLWARIAAAAIDYHFLPSVLVGLGLGVASPAFGSTLALRRSTLARIGGFEAVADQLADDHALGMMVREIGLEVSFPHYTVGHECAERSARDVFNHELRWARTVRSVAPVGYIGSVITHPVPLALLGLLFGGWTADCLFVPIAFACRFALQAELDRALDLQGDQFWLGPLRDLFSFVIFVASFFGRRVEWRGRRYAVRADSTLAYYNEAGTNAATVPSGALVRRI